MASRQRNPEATKDALIEAAEAILMEKGFSNISLSKVAKRAGITKSLIHHYFGSKEGLLREVKTRRFMLYAEQQYEMFRNTNPSAELLRASVAFYFDFLRQNPQIVRILAWMFLEQDQDEFFEMDRELIRQGVEKVRDAQTAGQLRSDIDPKFVVFIFIGLCQNWFQDKVRFTDSFNADGISGDLDEAYLSSMIKILFEGILPR
jgi:TetR/AcrR family transcriptional regulator